MHRYQVTTATTLIAMSEMGLSKFNYIWKSDTMVCSHGKATNEYFTITCWVAFVET